MKKSRSVFLLVLNILGHSSFLQPFVPVTCKFILIRFIHVDIQGFPKIEDLCDGLKG